MHDNASSIISYVRDISYCSSILIRFVIQMVLDSIDDLLRYVIRWDRSLKTFNNVYDYQPDLVDVEPVTI